MIKKQIKGKLNLIGPDFVFQLKRNKYLHGHISLVADQNKSGI